MHHLLIQRDAAGAYRVDIGLLYPPFLERLIEATGRAADRGAQYWWVRGFATWAEQHQLRQKFLNGTGGRAAPAGLSAHNYGLGSDFTFDADNDAPGLQPSWKDSQYEALGEEVTRAGLVWGASFKDRPHVNWPGFVSAKELAPLQGIWQATSGTVVDRLRAVWSYVDSHTPGA
jgi:peptidoglycan L-alanyl-D-glutamate endopeptidase CwlK